MRQSRFFDKSRSSIGMTLLLLWVLLMGPTAGWSRVNDAGVSIKMRPEVTVDGDTLLLGDIAVIESRDSVLVRELEALVVGRAPMPGKSRQIDAAYIVLRLKQKGIPEEWVALNETDMSRVTRSSTTLRREDIRRIIQDALDKKDLFQGQQGEIKEIRVTNDLLLPAGRLSYRVDISEKPSRSNRIPVSVSIFLDGRHFRKVWASLVVDIHREVVVLNHAMRRYQRITTDDVSRVSMPLSDIPQNAIHGDQNVVGKRVKKSLLSGTVLRTDTVELPPLIKRGDVVTILATSGALQVTTLGTAKNNGQQGDRIRVVNLDTRKVLFGYILDSKTVQVVF